MKKRKIKYLEKRSVEACVAYLQSLIHGLKSGNVGVTQADQEIHLRPAGVIDFGLRVEQLERNESIKLELSWRRDSVGAVDVKRRDFAAAAPGAKDRIAEDRIAEDRIAEGRSAEGRSAEGRIAEDDDAPTLTRMPSLDSERGADLARASEGHAPLSMRTLDRIAAAEYQRLYSAARSVDDQGHWHLDKERLMESLAEAGVDPLTQQELYSLALQADADGRSIMFSEQVIDALKQVTQRHALESHAGA